MNTGAKILKRASNSLGNSGYASRSDLKIADFVGIGDGKSTGQVLLAYDRNLSKPSGREIEEFFRANFGNLVVANLSTLSHVEAHPLCHLVANIQVQTRPVSDANDMTRMTPTTYIDKVSQSLWEVTSAEDGMKFLVRHVEDNLADVVASRAARVQRSLPKIAELTAMNKLGAPDVDVGDRVQFYDSGIITYGKVTSLKGERVTISCPTGKCTVDIRAVFKVVDKAQSAITDEKNLLDNYFEKAYGDPGFAKELTDTTSTEQGGGRTGY